MEGWKTPPPSSNQVSLVAAALLLNLGLREEKLHITVSLSHLPHENKQQLVEPLSPLKILNKDVIYGLQFLWNPMKFKECCEEDSAANLSETDIKVTVCARKWQLFGLNMQIICASFFPWVVEKLTLNILLFIKEDEDFIMTGIFNCSFFLYQICQNITLWGFYFVWFFFVCLFLLFFFLPFINIIRTKTENVGSRLDRCCWLFYKTTIKAYLIFSYMICYCSEKHSY